LHVAHEELDVFWFHQLVAAGRDALGGADAATAVRLLDQSLALWRGPALADLDELQFAQAEQARLEEERLGALESWFDARLMCGRHHEAIVELETLTARHPLRERFWAQWLLALYRCGRQADALRAYRELRSRLIEQLASNRVPSCGSSIAGFSARTRSSNTGQPGAATAVAAHLRKPAMPRAAGPTSPTRLSKKASRTSWPCPESSATSTYGGRILSPADSFGGWPRWDG
jgi:hypothetical protein